MTQTWRDVLSRLAAIEPLAVPEGEPGVALPGEYGKAGRYAPVLSVYLDWRLQATGAKLVRAGQVLLRQRIREIEKTFWPRGVAYASIQADTARIEEYLATQVAPETEGIALFASERHHLFETLQVGVPFDNQVSARALPNLFPLERLLDHEETAILALVHLNAARLFVISRGLLREVRESYDDPKFYHKVRRTGGLCQPRYQRHADLRRLQFAKETAASIEQLVKQEQAIQVILAGEEVAVSHVRQVLPPHILALTQPQPIRLDRYDAPLTMLEEVEPMLRAAEADQDRSVIERLVDEVRSDGLGVSGLELTHAALEQGQVDLLVLADETALPPQTRSQLIELALNTGARVEVVKQNADLRQLGGVGALLRYRSPELAKTEVPITSGGDVPERQLPV